MAEDEINKLYRKLEKMHESIDGLTLQVQIQNGNVKRNIKDIKILYETIGKLKDWMNQRIGRDEANSWARNPQILNLIKLALIAIILAIAGRDVASRILQ